ncbi:unnamed protein product [Musa textilis]
MRRCGCSRQKQIAEAALIHALSFAIHWGAVTLKVFANGPTLSPGFWYAYNNIEPSHVATVARHVMSTEQLLTSYYGFQDLPLSFSELGHGKISLAYTRRFPTSPPS